MTRVEHGSVRCTVTRAPSCCSQLTASDFMNRATGHVSSCQKTKFAQETCLECNCESGILGVYNQEPEILSIEANQDLIMYTCPSTGTMSKWVRKEALVDSGACDHVCSPTFLPMLAIKETDASKAGKCYVSANGGKMRNLGRQDVFTCDVEGSSFAIKLQVTGNRRL